MNGENIENIKDIKDEKLTTVPKNMADVGVKDEKKTGIATGITRDIEYDEVIYIGTVVELKGTGFIKLDKEKFRMINLGRNENSEDVRKLGSKRWGVIIPKGSEKEFVKALGNKWLLPDELADIEYSGSE